MGIVSLHDLVAHARQNGYALGYFEAWDQHSFEAVLEAAEEADAPTILGFGGAITSPVWMEQGGLEEQVALARALAERASVPTALLFNEARTLSHLLRGLRAGCNAVMLDSSHLPLEENLAVTRRVVEVAHALSAAVEAELGHLPEAGHEGGPSACTDPAEAARFVRETGVDLLAVSVGNTHLLLDGEATVDLDLLARLHRATEIPLVIHGGSGFPAQAVKPAIERGVVKFNVGTRLKKAFLDGLREGLAELPSQPDIQQALGSREAGDVLVRAKARVKAEIMPLMTLYGCTGQASTW